MKAKQEKGEGQEQIKIQCFAFSYWALLEPNRDLSSHLESVVCTKRNKYNSSFDIRIKAATTLNLKGDLKNCVSFV